MHITPHLSKRSLVTGLTVVSVTLAASVVFTVHATPSHAATSEAAAFTKCNGYVGLAFDDGPTNQYTPALLSALQQNGIRATVFNIGKNAQSAPSQVRAEVNAGMWVENHSYAHEHMDSMTQSQMLSDLSEAQSAIEAGGAPAPRIFRPPYGEHDSTLDSVAASLGLKVVTWDIDSQDWNGASTAAIVQANNELQNGQVILMHEWPANTIAAIPQIAQNLANRGMCPGMIDPSTGRAVAPTGSGGSTTTTASTTTTTASTTTTTKTSTSTTGGSTTSTAPPSGACTATYQVTSQWSNGFVAQVNVEAGSSALSTWKVTLTFANGQTVTSSWSATVAQSGSTVTATPASYNASLPAGGSTSFGFQGTFSGSNSAPTISCS
jgi:peptidoglycan/xylan/chitin deacetylase (PgdA/CDA1 family)